MANGYDIAQICLNGHLITDMAGSYPQHRQNYCARCGDVTTCECEGCKAEIRGYYHIPGYFGPSNFKLPNHCHQCGRTFPWTERKKLAAIELFIEETQDQEKQKEFRASVEEVAKDTPQAQVASKRINRLLGGIAKETGSAIRDILVDLASETAKKILFPGP